MIAKAVKRAEATKDGQKLDAHVRVSRGADSQSLHLRRLVLHGHRVAYRHAGSGPVIVLIHGITSSSATWARVMPYLARRFTVIAPT